MKKLILFVLIIFNFISPAKAEFSEIDFQELNKKEKIAVCIGMLMSYSTVCIRGDGGTKMLNFVAMQTVAFNNIYDESLDNYTSEVKAGMKFGLELSQNCSFDRKFMSFLSDNCAPNMAEINNKIEQMVK